MMKLIMSIVMVAAVLTVYGQVPSQEAVKAAIERLRETIIPAMGTTKAEVESVYGVGRETKKLNGNNGLPAHYSSHTYQLLPPQSGQDFRAFLYVTYREGKVYHVGINHICVVKGRVLYVPGSAGEKKQKETIASENVMVLADLKEIYQKYADVLTKASWNRRNPNKASVSNGVSAAGDH